MSCPNVATGLDIGADPRELEALLRAVRPLIAKPLIVKLTPNTADVAACAAGARGRRRRRRLADQHAARRARSRRTAGAPWLGGGNGGLSGPAIRTIALAQVARVAERVAIPVIGMGGVASGRDARELLDAGATLVAIGTESFRDPAAGAGSRVELERGFRANCAMITRGVVDVRTRERRRVSLKSPAKAAKQGQVS